MIFEQIQLLHEAQIYEDVKSLSSIALTLYDQNPDLLNGISKYQILCYLADSYYRLTEYRQAVTTYKHAMQVKKGVIKGKGKSVGTPEAWSEVEVKYRLHECYVQLKEDQEAIQTLKSINPKQRTIKINLALARLYHKTACTDRSAVAAYKDVLKECPMSLSSIQTLLSLGVKSVEVEQIIKSSTPTSCNTDWLSLWIKAQGQITNRDFQNACQTYESLNTNTLLSSNTYLIAELGEAQFLQGDYTAAHSTLSRLHTMNNRWIYKMDILAYLYYKLQNRASLDSLSTALLISSENFPEPWVALGYASCANKRHSRAIYFAQKALCIDSGCVEALLLKGTALMEVKKEQEAVSHFREALRIAPHRYEAYSSLVEAYIGCDRMREAVTCAAEACKQIYSARSLTLYATVLAKDPLNHEKATGCLDKAIRLDPNYLEAVYAMVGILKQQHQYDAAIRLLKGLLPRHSTSRIHRLLADLLAHTKDILGASEHFQMSIRFNHANMPQSFDGATRVDKSSTDVAAERTLDLDDDAMDSSDNEDRFRTIHRAARQMATPQFELDASASDEGDNDFPSDMAAFN